MKTLIVFAISLGVIGASELWKEDIEKHVEKWMSKLFENFVFINYYYAFRKIFHNSY